MHNISSVVATLIIVLAIPLWTSPANAQAILGVSSEEASARLTELSSSQTTLPDNDLMLFDELRRIDDEISRYRRVIGNARDRRAEGPNFDSVRDELSAGLAQAKQLECKSASSQAVSQVRQRLVNAVSQLSNLVLIRDLEALGANPWDVGFDDFLSSKTKKPCDDVKSYIGDAAREQSLFQYLDAAKKKLSELSDAQEVRVKQFAGVVEALQKRRGLIQEKLSARTTQQQIGGSLWIVISVIGAFSILAILAVKLFSETLQLEWVVSGQVIQFVTVMILLSVVMALGLAGILKENTLGTLLGGIAGYVLAQGVGRAAAREVSRGRSPGAGMDGGSNTVTAANPP